jgi:ribosome-binding protein aMBF1 (putative translation factor)
MTIPFAKIRERWMKDKNFRAEYERIGPEMEIAVAIAEARTRAGLTQKQLAERVGTTQSVISRLESGQAEPSTRTMKRIAEATHSRLHITLSPD